MSVRILLNLHGDCCNAFVVCYVVRFLDSNDDKRIFFIRNKEFDYISFAYFVHILFGGVDGISGGDCYNGLKSLRNEILNSYGNKKALSSFGASI